MILRNSDLLNKFNPQPYDGMPKNKKGTEEPIIDKSQDEVETYAYAKKADRERWKELMDKTKALMTTAQGRKLWYQNIKPQNLSIDELQRFVTGVQDYNKDAQDYQRARRKVEEGKIDSSAFVRMYNERGWSKFDTDVKRGYGPEAQYSAKEAKDEWGTGWKEFANLVNKFALAAPLLGGAAALGPAGIIEDQLGFLGISDASASAIGTAFNAPMLGVPGLTANNALWATGAYLSGDQIVDPNSLTRTSIAKAYKDPTAWNVTDAAGNVITTGLGFAGVPYKQGLTSLADDIFNIGRNVNTVKNTNTLIPLKNVVPTKQKSLLASFSHNPRLEEAINEANEIKKIFGSNKAPINKVEENIIYEYRPTGSILTEQEAKALYEEQDKISDAAYDFYMRYTMGNDYENKLAAFNKIKKETDTTIKKIQDLNLKDSNLYSTPAYKKYEEFSSEARNMFWRQNSSRSHTPEFSEDLAKFENQQRAKFIEENPETKAIFDELDQIQTEKTSLNEVWQQNLKVIPEEYFDPTFLKKIEDITGQPITNSDLFHGEVVDMSKIKDRIKLATTNPNDPVVKAMSAEDYASFNKNSLGVRTKTMTATKRGNFGLEPKLNDSGEWVYQPTETLNSAGEIGVTSAHELGHDRQKLFDWNTFLEKHDPVYNYRVNNEKSLLAQDMKKIMAKPSIDPTSTSYTYNTWRAAPSELDSDLFGQKFRHYYDTKNQYGQEAADKLLENLRTFNKESFDPLEWEKYYEKQLSDHFLSEEKYNSAFLNNQRNLVDSKLEELYGTDNYFDWLTGTGANKGGESSKIFKEMDEAAKTIKASLPSQTQENYHTLKNSILQRLPVIVPGAIGMGLGAYGATNTDLQQGYSHGGFVDNNPKKDLNSFLLKQKITQGTPLRYRNTESINLNLDKGQSPGPDFYKYGNLGTGDGNIVGVLGAGIPSKGLEANLLGVVPTQRNPYFGGFYNLGVQKQFPNSSLGVNLGMATSKETGNTFEPSVTYKRNFKEGGSLAPNIPTHYNFEGTPIYRDTTSLPFKDGGKREKRKNNNSFDNEHWKNVVTGKELQGIRARNLEDFELKKYIDTLPNIPYSQNDFNKHISTDEAIKRAHTAGNREEEDYLRSLKEKGIEKIQDFAEVTVSANKLVEKDRLKLLDEWRILNNTIKKYHKEKGLPDWQGAYAGTDMKKLQANIKDLRQRYEQEKDYYKEVSKTLDLLKEKMPEKYEDVKLKNFLTANTYNDINKDLTSIDEKQGRFAGSGYAYDFRKGIGRQFAPLSYNMSKEDWEQWKLKHPLGDHNWFQMDPEKFSKLAALAVAAPAAIVGGATALPELMTLAGEVPAAGSAAWSALRASPFIQAVGAASEAPILEAFVSSSAAPWLTVNNLLTGYSAYHLGTHSLPKYIKNPTLENFGWTTLDTIGALPLGISAFNEILPSVVKYGARVPSAFQGAGEYIRDIARPAIMQRGIKFKDIFTFDDYINIGNIKNLEAINEGIAAGRISPEATTGRFYSRLSSDPNAAKETLSYLQPIKEEGQGFSLLADQNRAAVIGKKGYLDQLSKISTNAVQNELKLRLLSNNSKNINITVPDLRNSIKILENDLNVLLNKKTPTLEDTLRIKQLKTILSEASPLEAQIRSIPRINELLANPFLLKNLQTKYNLSDAETLIVKDLSKGHSNYWNDARYLENPKIQNALRDTKYVSQEEFIGARPTKLDPIFDYNIEHLQDMIRYQNRITDEFKRQHPDFFPWEFKVKNFSNELNQIRRPIEAIHKFGEGVKEIADQRSGGSLNSKNFKIYKTSELY